MPVNTSTGSDTYDEALRKTASTLSRSDRRKYLQRSSRAARRYLRIHPSEVESEPSVVAIGVCGYCQRPMRLHGGPDLTVCPIGIINGMGVTLS